MRDGFSKLMLFESGFSKVPLSESLLASSNLEGELSIADKRIGLAKIGNSGFCFASDFSNFVACSSCLRFMLAFFFFMWINVVIQRLSPWSGQLIYI